MAHNTLLFYDYVADILERRGPHRDAHLAAAEAARAEGDLISAGVLGDPPYGALFVFAGDAVERAEAFAAADPYMAAGLITGHRVVPWNVVVGGA